jgi:hypothetical protein
MNKERSTGAATVVLRNAYSQSLPHSPPTDARPPAGPEAAQSTAFAPVDEEVRDGRGGHTIFAGVFAATPGLSGVTPKWSVFGEPGVIVYHGFVSDCPAGSWCGSAPQATGILPAFYAGGRYALNETTSLTMRVGYPTVSVGVSFF